MRSIRVAALLTLVVLTAGCWKATVTTGRPASGQTIHNGWAHSFIYGLVPPQTVEAASQCPNGVAQVQTQHSFVNMLAQLITFGIYSPMTITVQCAAGSPAPDDESVVRVPDEGTLEDFAKALNDAVERSRAEGAPVMVQFDGMDR